MARLKLAFAKDPQRARSRVVLALFTVFALIVIGVPDLSRLGDVAFGQASPSPTTGFSIQWVNPTSTTGKEVSNKEDGTGTGYHLVAWVNRVPSDPRVEFKVQKGSGFETNICEATRVATTDAWECFWAAPTNADGSDYTLRAILYSGNTEVARDEETGVEVNNQNPDSSNPTDRSEAQGQTVEITQPDNGEFIGFFTPSGGVPNTIIDLSLSAGTTSVDVYYTLSPPGTEPSWKACGGSPFTRGSSSITTQPSVKCNLASGDNPVAVTGIAATARDADPSPATSMGDAVDASDGHRVFPYLQTPSFVTLVNGNQARAQNTCTETITATVRDQHRGDPEFPSGRPIAGINTDVHAQGPTDNLRFGQGTTGSSATPTTETHAFKHPDKGHTAPAEPAIVCSDNSNSSMSQGQHEFPGNTGSGADIKHIETTAGGTADDGTFKFRLHSVDTGDTQFTVFADGDDDDLRCSSEASGNGAINWFPTGGSGSPPGPTGVPADTSSCPGPSPSPSPTSPSPTPTPTTTSTGSPSPTPTATPTPTPRAECEDGADNDGDGQTDFPNDPDCESSTDDSETHVPEDVTVTTNLTIRYDAGSFRGSVRSSRFKRCETFRAVTLKKKRPGRDPVVGSDLSSRAGDWKIRKPSARGSYYARVAQKTFTAANGDRVTCLAGRSSTITVRRR